jgi:hypothetical protein
VVLGSLHGCSHHTKSVFAAAYLDVHAAASACRGTTDLMFPSHTV